MAKQNTPKINSFLDQVDLLDRMSEGEIDELLKNEDMFENTMDSDDESSYIGTDPVSVKLSSSSKPDQEGMDVKGEDKEQNQGTDKMETIESNSSDQEIPEDQAESQQISSVKIMKASVPPPSLQEMKKAFLNKNHIGKNTESSVSVQTKEQSAHYTTLFTSGPNWSDIMGYDEGQKSVSIEDCTEEEEESTPFDMTQTIMEEQLAAVAEIDGQNIMDYTGQKTLTVNSTIPAIELVHNKLKNKVENSVPVQITYAQSGISVEHHQYVKISEFLDSDGFRNDPAIDSKFDKFRLFVISIFGDNISNLLESVENLLYPTIKSCIMQSWIDCNVQDTSTSITWLNFLTGYLNGLHHAHITGLQEMIPSTAKSLESATGMVLESSEMLSKSLINIQTITDSDQQARNAIISVAKELTKLPSKIESLFEQWLTRKDEGSVLNSSFGQEAIVPHQTCSSDHTRAEIIPIDDMTVHQGCTGNNICTIEYHLSIRQIGHIVFFNYLPGEKIFTNCAISKGLSKYFPPSVFDAFINKACCYITLISKRPVQMSPKKFGEMVVNCLLDECNNECNIEDLGDIDADWDSNTDPIDYTEDAQIDAKLVTEIKRWNDPQLKLQVDMPRRKTFIKCTRRLGKQTTQ